MTRRRRVSKFLNKGYTKYDPANEPWKNGLFSAAIVLLMFLLFQPFGFRDKDISLKLILFPFYSFLAYLYSIGNFFFVRQILKSKKKWFLKNELISLAICMLSIAFIVHIVTVWLTGDMPLSFNWYFKILYHVSSFLLVIAVVEFFYYNYKLADNIIEQYSSQLQLVSGQLGATKQNSDIEFVTVSLEKESIEINRHKTVYIKSIGNYLEFYFRESNGEIKKLVKRGRIHIVEKDMKAFPEFLRCHRAYIINLKLTKQIKGNSKKAKLVFDKKLEEIPISRSQLKILKVQLDKIITG